MRYFVQAFIVIVGFSLAIMAAQADQGRSVIGTCFAASGSVPTICN